MVGSKIAESFKGGNIGGKSLPYLTNWPLLAKDADNYSGNIELSGILRIGAMFDKPQSD